MGYTTEFWGQVELDPPLTEEQQHYLRLFSGTRRVRRDVSLILTDYDPLIVDSFGVDGEFYVGGEGFKGQGIDPSVINNNEPPDTQPGLWCQWVPNDDGTALQWDGGEKFYEYVKWMEYIVKNFIVPWGVTANGEIQWSGEAQGDMGKIVVIDNVVTTKHALISYV